MKRLSFVLLAVASAFALPAAALAVPIVDYYTFTFTGTGFDYSYPNTTPATIDATGWLDINTSPIPPVPPGPFSVVTPGMPPAYEVIAGALTFNGTTFDLITDPAARLGYYFKAFISTGCCGIIVDNLLFPEQGNGYFMDGNGLAFSNQPKSGIQLFSYGGPGNDYLQDTVSKDESIEGYGTFTLTATPEPNSAVLLGTGMIGLILIALRRKQHGSLPG